MCGIHAVISNAATAPLSQATKEALCNRGPDHFGQVTTRISSANNNGPATFLTFTSTVLSLRGTLVAAQPFVHSQTGSVLCWNGEAWKIDGRPVEGNDGDVIFDLLSEASASAAADEGIIKVLRSIQGPFAFVYFDKPAGKVYYGRDRLGRRSLLVSSGDDDGGFMTISSIADHSDASWKEVEADGIYVVDLVSDRKISSSLSFFPRTPSRYEWVPEPDGDLVLSIGKFNTSLPTSNTPRLEYSGPVFMLRDQLLNALRLRVLNIPPPPATSMPASSLPETRIAILFSGGLDCTVLARLCHDLLPGEEAVDLLNVAFENPRIAGQLRKHAGSADIDDVYEACPDRVTGRKAFAELQKVCPGRSFRFIAINVPYTETTAHRAQVISLMNPHNTEMDLSIACALYFAARGKGICYEQSDPALPSAPYSYCTPARVLLSGLGADELFGGYVRHSTAFLRRGYPGLIDELKLDVSRLGKRNLGRDDRVMAHWGKEVRFPYLDEELVKWAIERPAWEKCDFDNAEELSGVETPWKYVEPGKRVLRLLAQWLELTQVAVEKKRAIQFGSRTAKMESGRVKGTALVS